MMKQRPKKKRKDLWTKKRIDRCKKKRDGNRKRIQDKRKRKKRGIKRKNETNIEAMLLRSSFLVLVLQLLGWWPQN